MPITTKDQIVPDQEPSPIRVVLLQPDGAMDGGLHDMLKSEPRLLVDWYTCPAAAGQSYAQRPDLVLLHLGPAAGDSRDLIDGLRAYWPTCPLVAISPAPSLDQWSMLLSAGVRGYLRSPLALPDLLAAIQLAISGGLALCPTTAALLTRFLLPQITRQAATAALSPRELAISARISSGQSNKAIAQDLDIAIKTVEWYVARLLQKTNMRSRVELAVWWSHNAPLAHEF